MALILSHTSACEYWLSPYASSDYMPLLNYDLNSVFFNQSDFSKGSRQGTKNSRREFLPINFLYYDSARSLHSEPETIRKNSNIALSLIDLEKVSSFAGSMEETFSTPLHAMVFRRDNRRKNDKVVFHVCSSKLPPRTFYCLEPDVYVVSPELCFIQMANELSEIELLKLGYDLTAQYSLMPQGGFVFRAPITNQKRLMETAKYLSGFKGIKKAHRVLPYICDNAASVREAELAMLLSLPCSRGGFGLPKPMLNVAIAIPKAKRNLFMKDYYVCDLFWGDALLAIEYDSDQYHMGIDRIGNDAAKRNALELMGIKVVTVTNKQIKNNTELEIVARIVSKALGRKFRISRGYDYPYRQTELRNKVLFSDRKKY